MKEKTKKKTREYYFKPGNKESVKGGKASAKSRFKGKSKKQISEIMKKLRVKQIYENIKI